MLLSKYIVEMTELMEYKYDNTIILHYVKHFTDFLYSVQKSRITAAGTVQDLHLIPF